MMFDLMTFYYGYIMILLARLWAVLLLLHVKFYQVWLTTNCPSWIIGINVINIECRQHVVWFPGAAPSTPKPCVNKLTSCENYGKQVCVDYRGWAGDNCAKYCGFCCMYTSCGYWMHMHISLVIWCFFCEIFFPHLECFIWIFTYTLQQLHSQHLDQMVGFNFPCFAILTIILRLWKYTVCKVLKYLRVWLQRRIQRYLPAKLKPWSWSPQQ
jgi:hypothetical protein